MLARQAITNLNRSLLRNGPRALSSEANFSLRAASSAANNKSQSNAEGMTQAGAMGLAVLAGAFAAGTVTFAESEYWHPKPISVEIKKPASKFYAIAADNLPPKRPDLPTIPLEKVAEHNDENDMWYTYRGAVYDMSFFLQGHPGGAPVRPFSGLLFAFLAGL